MCRQLTWNGIPIENDPSISIAIISERLLTLDSTIRTLYLCDSILSAPKKYFQGLRIKFLLCSRCNTVTFKLVETSHYFFDDDLISLCPLGYQHKSCRFNLIPFGSYFRFLYSISSPKSFCCSLEGPAWCRSSSVTYAMLAATSFFISSILLPQYRISLALCEYYFLHNIFSFQNASGI